jgi:hypothetical protein
MTVRLRVAAALIAATTLLAGPPVAAQDDTLRALAERLARESALGPSDIELDVGTIPALPVAFGPPSGARIVGTAVERPRAGASGTFNRSTRYRVYFTAALAPRALVDAVTAGFAREGYAVKPVAFGPAAGGFTNRTVMVANLCRGITDPALFVRARSAGAGGTDAVLEETVPAANNAPFVSPCDPVRAGDPRAMLPELRSAPATTVTLRGNYTGPDAATETADVFTSLAPRAVIEGFASQAVADGWAERSVVSTDAVATALLARAVDGQPRLLVITLARVSPGQFYASLTNAAAPAEPTPTSAGQ